jgi:SAM-dependent methyltransferase
MTNQNYQSLKDAVAILPEIYQPIYNHPELYNDSSRVCADRLIYIKNIYDSLSKKLGRSLRVLDLGCAQGFISLTIASWGATVKGIDFLDKNIAVCQILMKEFPNYKVQFECNQIENCIETLKSGEYDLVLGLSVFHHLCNIHGWEYVREKINVLAQNISVGIYELALRDEPLYWAKSLPIDFRFLLSGYSCVKTIAMSKTHLSDIKRPLCFASNKYVFFSPNILITIEKYLPASHHLVDNVHNGTRRYFIGEKKFIKFFCLNNIGKHPIDLPNKQEIFNEIQILKKFGGKCGFPLLLKYENKFDETWVMREAFDGELLSDLIEKNVEYNPWDIIRQVLEYLIDLENEGYYYNDLRMWNIIISSNSKVHLIDYGAIIKSKRDCQWPENLILSFLIFMDEVINKKLRILPVRRVSLISSLKKNVSITKLYKILELPSNDKLLFKELYEILFSKDDSIDIHCKTREEIFISYENLLDRVVDDISAHENAIDDIKKRIDYLQNNYNELANTNGDQITEIREKYKNLYNNLIRLNTKVENQSNELHAITTSKVYEMYKIISKIKHFIKR